MDANPEAGTGRSAGRAVADAGAHARTADP
jgi:hypothetical protein